MMTMGLQYTRTDFYEWYIKSRNDFDKIWSDGMSFTVSD